MANPHHTPRRSVRVSEELWTAAQVKAAERGETVTDVIVRALKRYVRSKS
jgi:predicted HicB family RNase H-like nuclease